MLKRLTLMLIVLVAFAMARDQYKSFPASREGINTSVSLGSGSMFSDTKTVTGSCSYSGRGFTSIRVSWTAYDKDGYAVGSGSGGGSGKFKFSKKVSDTAVSVKITGVKAKFLGAQNEWWIFND